MSESHISKDSDAMRIAFVGWLFFVGITLGQPAKPASTSKDGTPEKVVEFGGKTLKGWMAQLTSADPSKRALAIVAIAQFGDEAEEAVPAIVPLTRDKDVSPRSKAIMALRTIPVRKDHMPAVIDAVGKRLNPALELQAVIRYEAALTLYRLEKDAQAAIPVLIQGTLDTASWEIRHLCVAALWRVALSGQGKDKDAPPDPKVVEAMLNLLKNDRTYQVRLETLQGIGALGRPSDPSLRSRVVDMLNTCARPGPNTPLANYPLAIWAYAGLVCMQDGTAAAMALNTLGKFLKHENLELRSQAAIAVGALGKLGQSKVPDLLAMLDDKESVAVQAVCSALGNMGEKTDRIVEPLLRVAEHKDPIRASAAVTALVDLHANSKRVTEALDKMLENKNLHIQVRFTIENGLKDLKKPRQETK